MSIEHTSHAGYVAPSLSKIAETIAASTALSLISGFPETIYIVGPARSGKTTVIRELKQKLAERGILVVTSIPKEVTNPMVLIIDEDGSMRFTPYQLKQCVRNGIPCVITSTSAQPEADVKVYHVPELSIDELMGIVKHHVPALEEQIGEEATRHVVTAVQSRGGDIPTLVKVATVLALSNNPTSEQELYRSMKLCGIRVLHPMSDSEIADKLSRSLIGQEHVILEIAPLIADMTNVVLQKPLAFLFTGPSGVGKTYTGELIATLLGVPIYIEHLNTMTASHDVSRLLGAPPGYLGHGVKTPFVRFVEQNPHGGVLLFDEVDKAPQSLTDVILSLAETGKFQDACGVTHSVSNYIIVMTSNESVSTAKVGFGTSTVTDRLPSLRKEFISRLDKIVEFTHLSREHVEQIVQILVEIEGLELNKARREKFIKLCQERHNEVVSSYSPEFGIRPVKTYIRKLRQEARNHI